MSGLGGDIEWDTDSDAVSASVWVSVDYDIWQPYLNQQQIRQHDQYQYQNNNMRDLEDDEKNSQVSLNVSDVSGSYNNQQETVDHLDHLEKASHASLDKESLSSFSKDDGGPEIDDTEMLDRL